MASIILNFLLLVTNFFAWMKVYDLKREIQRLKEDLMTKGGLENLLEKAPKDSRAGQSSARETVQKFLEAEMRGVWLKPGKFQNFMQHFLFVFEPGEEVIVVKKAEIVSEYVFEEEGFAIVKVKYFCDQVVFPGHTSYAEEKIIKEFNDGAVIVSIPCNVYFKDLSKIQFVDYDYQNQVENTIFILKKEKGIWKIAYLTFLPHVSIEAFHEHLKSL